MPKKFNEDEIFKAVVKLLTTKGYAQTTTSEMAAAANMHEATLFRKYGSKVGLVRRAIEQQLLTTPLKQITYTGDLQADIIAILEAYVETVEVHGEIMPLLLVEIPRHPELREALKTPLANLEGIFRILEQYQREGLLKSESPLTSITALLGPLMVNGMYRRVLGELQTPTIDIVAYADAFLHGRKPHA